MKTTKKRRIHHAWWIMVSLCFIMVGALGIIANCYGVFLQPVGDDLGISRAELSTYFTFVCITMLICVPIAQRIMLKVNNIRLILILCLILTCSSTGVMGAYNKVGWWWFSGVTDGLAQSFLTFLLIPYLINNWFKKKVGLVTGICCSMTGLGGALFSPVIGWFITEFGWRLAYPMAAGIALLLSLPFAIFVIRDRPSDMGLKPYGADELSEAVDMSIKGIPNETKLTGVPYKEAIKSPVYIMSLIFVFCVSMNGNFQNQITAYAYTQGFPVALGSFVASASLAGSVGGNLLVGAIADRFGVRVAVPIGLGFGVVGSLVLLFLAGTAPAMVFAGAVLFGISYSQLQLAPQLLAREIWGQRDYNKIYSMTIPALSLASAIANPIYGAIFDATGTYTNGFIMAICCLIIAIIMCFAAVGVARKRWGGFSK